MLDIFIKKKTFIWFLLVLITLVGLFVMVAIPKESLPEIKIPIVGVTTVYPGASSFDVERLVTNPLEKQLMRTLKDVESINSSSREGVSIITINFDASIDLGDALAQVKDEVDKVKNDLPTDSSDPVIQEFSFDDQPIFIVSLSSREAFTLLSDTVDSVEDIFLDVPGVSKVEIAGIPKREVSVILDKNALRQYGISASQVVQRIKQSDFSLPAGSIIQSGIEYNITIDNTVENLDDINNVIVSTNQAGQHVYVKDIAVIEDGLASYTSLSRLSVAGSEPQQAITFSVFKQVGSDITKVTKGIRRGLEVVQENIPGTEFITLIDAGSDISTDILNLSKSALQTIFLVILILSIGLGIRESVIAGFAVPLSFLLTFIALYFTGFTINFISLFSLILAIGLLVDASIVIIEGISLARSKGLSPDEAIRSTLKEFAAPVIAGTMTTLVVFVPLATLSGITGQFIKSIPITIIFVLISSLIVALIFIPLMSTVNVSSRKPFLWMDRLSIWREKNMLKLELWYRNKLHSLLENTTYSKRLVRGLITLFIASIALVGSGLIKSEFFPKDNFVQLTISAELPRGSLLGNMDTAMQPLESYLQSNEMVESFVTQIRPVTADINVIISDKKYGEKVLQDIRTFIDTSYNGKATLLVAPPANGPSSGAPVAIELTGNNYDEVVATSIAFEKILSSIEGTTDVRSSVSENVVGIVIHLDVEKIRQAGLEPINLASMIRTSIFGSEATSLKYDDEDVSVMVRTALNQDYTSSDTTTHISLDQIRSLTIETPSGQVPLGAFMRENVKGNTPVISHKEGNRIVSVSSYLLEGVALSDITQEFSTALKDFELSSEVSWNFGGDVEESAKSGMQLMMALLAGIALVIGVLIFQFNSVKKTVFIISVIPLGLIGVLFGLFIFNQTLSFTAMLGFVALVGIVVNNSIILIDVLGSLQDATDLPHLDLVIEGSVSRLRPILLTTTTTVIGMAPLLMTSPMWRPLALAIISGLLFAVVLTLLLIPLFFYRYGKKKNK